MSVPTAKPVIAVVHESVNGTLRHANGHWECLFIGAHQKSSAHGQNDANDPTRTSADSIDQQLYSLKAERLATVSIIGC